MSVQGQLCKGGPARRRAGSDQAAWQGILAQRHTAGEEVGGCHVGELARMPGAVLTQGAGCVVTEAHCSSTVGDAAGWAELLPKDWSALGFMLLPELRL